LLGLLPCLIWAPHDGSKKIFAKRINELNASAILGDITEFCTSFYDINVNIFSNVDLLESTLEKKLNGLNITIVQLTALAAMAREHGLLLSIVKDLQELPSRGRTSIEYMSSLLSIADQFDGSTELMRDTEFASILGDTKRWLKFGRTIFSAVLNGSDPSIPHTITSIRQGDKLVEQLPPTALRVERVELLKDTATVAEFYYYLADSKDAESLAERSFLEVIRRWRGYIKSVIVEGVGNINGDDIVDYPITILTAQRIANGLVYLGVEIPNELVKKVRVAVEELISPGVFATTTAIRLYMYDCIRARVSTIREAMRGARSDADASIALAEEWRDKVQSYVDQIELESNKISWPMFEHYEVRRLPETLPSGVALENRPYLPTFEVAAGLRSEIQTRLQPIERVMSEIYVGDIPTTEEQAREIVRQSSNIIIVAAGAKLNLADQMEISEMNTVQSGGVSISGVVGSVGGDIVGLDKVTTTVSHKLSTVTVVNSALQPIADLVEEVPAEAKSKAGPKLTALDQEVSKGDDADDSSIAGFLQDIVEAIPKAAGVVASAFATPILSGIAGPVTNFVLDRFRGA
jgi:hypothetical protein